jgi:putative flippase GtrA
VQTGLSARWRLIVAEFAKFGVVGAICTVVDVGLFNVLHFGAGVDPLLAKTMSVAVATTVSYLGNRHWSFRHRARTGFGREYALFFVLNAIGLGFALGCLAVTKYGFGLSGPLALNLAGNVVGMGGATLFRFWAYRRWVFLATGPAEQLATQRAEERFDVRAAEPAVPADGASAREAAVVGPAADRLGVHPE